MGHKLKLDIGTKPGQVITPIMGKQFRITLDSLAARQFLDGLRLRADSWRKTEKYLESGYLTAHHEKVLAAVEGQVAEQGGW